MQMEEMAEYRNQVLMDAVSAKKDNDKPNSNKSCNDGMRERPPREQRYAHYTPFTASRSHIMDQSFYRQKEPTHRQKLTTQNIDSITAIAITRRRNDWPSKGVRPQATVIQA